MSGKTLQDFGYGFNDDGKLKKLDKETGEPGEEAFDFNVSSSHSTNQKHYEDLGDTITNHVYELLEKTGLHKIYVPEDIPREQATFIFTSKEKLDKPKKLMILIHGSGVVRAGQWARSLIINQSLDHGTMLPYIKKGRELGYDILITNGNDNYRNVGGSEKAIPGHSSPTVHATTIWEKYVMGCDPESVAIVAHSYGGVVALDLARKFPEAFKDKVFALGFTDSVHSVSSSHKELASVVQSIGRNYVTSSKPLNEELSSGGADIPRYSAGHTKHEWTSYSCMTALFDFLETKYEEFLDEKSAKKPKIG